MRNSICILITLVKPSCEEVIKINSKIIRITQVLNLEKRNRLAMINYNKLGKE